MEYKLGQCIVFPSGETLTGQIVEVFSTHYEVRQSNGMYRTVNKTSVLRRASGEDLRMIQREDRSKLPPGYVMKHSYSAFAEDCMGNSRREWVCGCTSDSNEALMITAGTKEDCEQKMIAHCWNHYDLKRMPDEEKLQLLLEAGRRRGDLLFSEMFQVLEILARRK